MKMNRLSLILEQKIKNKKVKVGIMGLGYVGLPLVKAFLKKGFSVTGFDVDPRKIRMLKQGKSYLKHISVEDVRSAFKTGRFFPTADFSLISKADVIIICVPTPLDSHRNPDLSFVLQTTKTIASYLKKGQLVVLESTTYPGTTDDEMRPILEGGGLEAGKDFFLAFSPERENPGDPVFSTERIPKVIGGFSKDCLRVANALYSQVVVKTIPVSSTKVAEATKLLENIFRSVNIAMVNEMKMILDRMGIDVWEVIKAASSKPFGFTPFYPGPGLGGHCIPIDPFYLTWKAREVDYSTKFIELAGEINTSMPYYVISKTIGALGERGKSIKGAKVLVLGLAYKKDIDDQRESPSVKIISLLKEKGAGVSYNDPLVPETGPYREYPGLSMKSVPLTAGRLKRTDAVIIATDHSAYDYDWIVKNAPLVIDTRNAIKKKRANVIKA
jgi:UDP-N-acetyl-D-glucosamine dehydrogenase